MQVLINAGGKGSRMGLCGIEKPMQIIGGVPVIKRVIDAMLGSENVDRILVTVSDNTFETEKYLKKIGIETLHTSGESFMDDLHDAFSILGGDFILTCPSDMPLLTTSVIDRIVNAFDPKNMESMVVAVKCTVAESIGTIPSYSYERNGLKWVLTGLSVMDREKTIAGDYLEQSYLDTDWPEVALNVNTQDELTIARLMFRE